jgi:hypothetical protein
LSGNASTAEINITIPFNVIVGWRYRIRVSNSPAYIGTDNGSDISIIQGQRQVLVTLVRLIVQVIRIKLKQCQVSLKVHILHQLQA